jgi:hypothetical protein
MQNKKTKPSAVLLLWIAVIALFGQFWGQSVYDEKENERLWKKWLRQNPPQKAAIPLSLKSVFPDPDKVDERSLLWQAWQFCFHDNKFWLSDRRECRIVQFGADGMFIRSFGRKGQGPGEFASPYQVLFGDELLVVNDPGNRRIEFFTQEGQYLKAIKVTKGYSEIAVTKDRKILAVPARTGRHDPLVDVLDEKGMLLYSFGEPFHGNIDWQILNNVKLSINDKAEVYLCSIYFPYVYKYSSHGKLMASVYLDDGLLKEAQERNRKRNAERQATGSGAAQYSSILSSIKTDTNSFFVLYSGPRILIIEGNDMGIKKQYYIEKSSYLDDAVDFIITEEQTKKIFYVLYRSPENRIQKYFEK